MTPAQRGVTSWAPHVAAGYVPPFALGLDVNSVNGWPFPCGQLHSGRSGWVTALAGGARPPAGDRLTGNEIDGYALFGEINIGLGEKFDLTIGYRFHDQTADQDHFNVAAGVAGGRDGGRSRRARTWSSRRATSTRASCSGRPLGTVELRRRHVPHRGQVAAHDDVMFYLGYTEGFNSGGLAVYRDSLGRWNRRSTPRRSRTPRSASARIWSMAGCA